MRNPEKRRAWLERYLASDEGKRVTAAYYAKNKETYIARSRKNYRENAEAKREAAKIYRVNNREKYLAAKKKHKEANRTKVNADQRKYAKENPEIINALNRNWRARRSKAEGSHTAEDVARIRREQDNRCAYCRVELGTGRKAHLDHIQPLANGGSNWPDNLQWLCQPCNNRKSAKDPVVFAAQNGFVS